MMTIANKYRNAPGDSIEGDPALSVSDLCPMHGAVTPHIARVVFRLGGPPLPFGVPWSLLPETLMPERAVALYAARVAHG